jgi:methyl-galactoside transport system ATP-binding protein
MDEPTSSLTEAESELLFKIIGRLKEQGVTILYISHKIKEVLDISDEITIMRDGKVMGTWPREELTTDLIVSRMVGREMNNLYPPKQHSPGEVYLQVENLTSTNPGSFRNISFEVRKGEILGIGGLVGAQRTELMEAIFGLRKIAKGSITIAGRKINITCPQDAIEKGLALLTEERRTTGIFPMLSVKENIVISKQKSHRKDFRRRSFFINEKERNSDAQQYVNKLSIKTPSLKTEIQYLSGGNQQKALLGRWLLVDPEILILDEPTRGIDVGAKYEIYCLMEKMTQEGKCVIMVSSEMQELMGLSDRILIMCEGHVSGILEGDSFTEENIMYLASVVKNNVNKEEVTNA